MHMPTWRRWLPTCAAPSHHVRRPQRRCACPPAPADDFGRLRLAPLPPAGAPPAPAPSERQMCWLCETWLLVLTMVKVGTSNCKVGTSYCDVQRDVRPLHLLRRFAVLGVSRFSMEPMPISEAKVAVSTTVAMQAPLKYSMHAESTPARGLACRRATGMASKLQLPPPRPAMRPRRQLQASLWWNTASGVDRNEVSSPRRQ